MSFGWGANNASLVSVGTTPATAVYIGTLKVWPDYTPVLSQWYTPTPSTADTIGNGINVPWPAGARKCDVIAISGGAGGTGTGVGGNAPLGGGAGVWRGTTIDTSIVGGAISSLRLIVLSQGGFDGAGGGNFNTEAADGCKVGVFDGRFNDPPFANWLAGGVEGQSNTGNRNGGNVAATYTFNGRTYTAASYGPGAGQGGASSNKNGSAGSAPGGGGQSADNGGLTGFSGGRGASAGAFILYWY
jgi:hypothetical protein